MLFKRIISALVLYPLLILLIFKAPWYFLLIITLLCSLICFKEISFLFEFPKNFYFTGHIVLVLLFLCVFFNILSPILALFLGLFFCFLAFLFNYQQYLFFEKFLPFYLGIVYLFIGFYPLLVFIKENEKILLFYLFNVVFAGDIGAYFVGKFFGKKKLAPSLSPKKTWEGFFGGIVLATLVSFFISRYFNLFPTLLSLVFGVALSLCGAVGDLFESALKRAVNKKDSGFIIPGHGGLLDRIDGVLFSAPLFLLLVEIIKFK